MFLIKNYGLLTYVWEESTQGPPRKYYELTPEGTVFLNELDNAWKELNQVIDHIKEQ